MPKSIWDNEKLIETLKNGGVVVMPTDTIYGIVGRADSRKVVEKIYFIRKRNPEKPCIILIGDIKELEKFSISISDIQKKVIAEYWPGPVSIVFDCVDEKFEYLHRGTNTLAFRLPKDEGFRSLLNTVGALLAPSANLEALPPSKNIEEAKNYFSPPTPDQKGGRAGDSVDLYVDGGEIVAKPSKIIRLHKDGIVTIIRQ